MAFNRKYQAYENNAVHTASGGKLTLMLYNGCIRFINQAIKDIHENNYESKNKHIQKAQNIIRELMLTLDHEIDISNQLLSLYEYINHQLQEANIKNDINLLKEAMEFVVDFRDTWNQALIQTNTKRHEESTQV